MPKVEVLKPFRGAEGMVHPGDMIEVDELRHRALAFHGLVPPPSGDDRSTEPEKADDGVLTGRRTGRKRSKIVGDA